jgi:hypothetical protein
MWHFLASSDPRPSSAESGPWISGLSLSCDPSPIVKQTETPGLFCSPGCSMGDSQSHRSGMMCEPYKVDTCKASMCLQVVFPARICRLQELAQAWKDSEAAYTRMSSGSSAKRSRRSSSSKTSPGSVNISPESAPTSPPSATSFAPDYCPRLRSELPINGTAFSSLLPTLTASSYGSNRGGAAGREGQKPRHSIQDLIKHNMLPTLTVKGNYNRAGLSAKSGNGICTTTMETTGKRLTIQFACWMQGLPLGWLDNAFSETHARRSNTRRRSVRSSDYQTQLERNSAPNE